MVPSHMHGLQQVTPKAASIQVLSHIWRKNRSEELPLGGGRAGHCSQLEQVGSGGQGRAKSFHVAEHQCVALVAGQQENTLLVLHLIILTIHLTLKLKLVYHACKLDQNTVLTLNYSQVGNIL